MEHKKGISNEFFPDDDFERMLEEKTKGWQKSPSAMEILDAQRPVKHLHEKQNVGNAADESLSTSNSRETHDDAPASQSSDANGADGQPSPNADVPADSPIYKPNADGIVEAAPTSAEVDEAAAEEAKERRRQNLHPVVEHITPVSDPAYSKSIIEGKGQKAVIRGIATGPWAKQHVEIETISKEEILKGLGHEAIAHIWNRAVASAQHCNGDIDRLTHHIDLLHKAAFIQSWYRDAYKLELDKIILNGSEAERARAEALYTKMYREQGKRIKPDGSTGRGKTISEAKPKAPKAEKLLSDTKKSIDTLLTIGVTYDVMVEKFKNAGKLNAPALDYIKSCFGKA